MISKDTAVVLGDHDRRLRNLEAAINSLDGVIAELREEMRNANDFIAMADEAITDLRRRTGLNGADIMRDGK